MTNSNKQHRVSSVNQLSSRSFQSVSTHSLVRRRKKKSWIKSKLMNVMDIFVPFPIYTSFAGVFLLMPSSHHKLLSSQPKPMSLTSALLQSLMDNDATSTGRCIALRILMMWLFKHSLSSVWRRTWHLHRREDFFPMHTNVFLKNSLLFSSREWAALSGCKNVQEVVWNCHAKQRLSWKCLIVQCCCAHQHLYILTSIPVFLPLTNFVHPLFRPSHSYNLATSPMIRLFLHPAFLLLLASPPQ